MFRGLRSAGEGGVEPVSDNSHSNSANNHINSSNNNSKRANTNIV